MIRNVVGVLVYFVSWAIVGAFVVWFLGSVLRVTIHRNLGRNRSRVLGELGRSQADSTLLGFFHPYCNAGGGGERVLWAAVRQVQNDFSQIVCVIYTGDLEATKDQILHKVHTNFNIQLDPTRIVFIYLEKRYLVEDSRYPRFTLLLQSLGSIALGYEAISKLAPDVFFDTMGYAFTYPLVSFLTHITIAAYVHYPTISSDMLQRVYERRTQYNNKASLAQSAIWSAGKMAYYRMFAKAYGFCGSFANHVMVNSSWTKGHVDTLWNTDAAIVYPPCDTERLKGLELDSRKLMVVSVAQFRPEKDHTMQLAALARLFEKHPKYKTEGVQLVFIGSSRNESDQARIDQLEKECVRLGIKDQVVFKVNASFDVLVSYLGMAKVGLHTMWNEHFGIGVVEYLAAGLIPVAHESGGPKMDIVIEYNGQRTGFLASTVEGFADCLHEALSLSNADYRRMANNGRASAAERFSETAFGSELLPCMRQCLT